ncbi:hypothetical protein BJX61DRAFT_529491 [Aspergillus egyptiacus]|nr:hypothetical protein BJX61DRAFT_529491 [Aspergillus egyptiacus]
MLDFLFSRGYQYPSPDIQERRTTELYPPLEIAISRRDIPAVKFLLERGVNLPHNGRLMKIFTELLTSGNDGDVKTELEIIDLLLCQGATLNPRDELFGHHPCLHQLIPCRDVSVLCALLDRGANPLLYCNTTDGGTNRDERCALDLAVLHDFPDGLAVMLEKVWGTVEESERGYVGFVVSRVKEIARSEKKSRCLRVLERFEYGRGLHLIEAQRNGGNGYFYDVSRKKEVSTGRNCLSCGGSKGGFCACLEEYVW